MKKITLFTALALVCSILTLLLVSCGGGLPDDPHKAKKAMEKADFNSARIMENQENAEGIKFDVVVGTKDARTLFLVYCKTEADADAVEKLINDNFSTYDEQYDGDFAVGREGNLIWYGNEGMVDYIN